MTNVAEPSGAGLPAHLEKARSRVTVEYKKIVNPVGTYGARTYERLGFDNSLNMETFVRECKVQIESITDDDLVFDIIGVDAPIANAIRRILLAEVPTMAIENVFIHDNSSIMHDEMLAHRLGLVPLKIDPRRFQTWKKGDPVTPNNTVKFRLLAKCEHRRSAHRDPHAPPEVLYEGSKVFSKSIEHVPFGDQRELLQGVTPRPVHDDLLLVKMRPGQAIHVEMNATKNIGKEHAKWSPVATAAYRMLPEVTLKQPVRGDDATALQQLCPANVFDIEDGFATVARPRDCTVCRECVRAPWSEKVELTRKRDHFIFSVESTGAMSAATLVLEALEVLVKKCDVVERELDAALKRRAPEEDVAGNRSDQDMANDVEMEEAS